MFEIQGGLGGTALFVLNKKVDIIPALVLKIHYDSLHPYREWAIMSVNGKRTCFRQTPERRSQ